MQRRIFHVSHKSLKGATDVRLIQISDFQRAANKHLYQYTVPWRGAQVTTDKYTVYTVLYTGAAP